MGGGGLFSILKSDSMFNTKYQSVDCGGFVVWTEMNALEFADGLMLIRCNYKCNPPFSSALEYFMHSSVFFLHVPISNKSQTEDLISVHVQG